MYVQTVSRSWIWLQNLADAFMAPVSERELDCCMRTWSLVAFFNDRSWTFETLVDWCNILFFTQIEIITQSMRSV